MEKEDPGLLSKFKKGHNSVKIHVRVMGLGRKPPIMLLNNCEVSTYFLQ
jgi:hypothetical protein